MHPEAQSAVPGPIEWEAAPCLVCGGTGGVPSDEVIWRDETFRYVLCAGCGLKYMCPRPTERWYRAFYEREFWQEKIEYRGYSAKQGRPRLADEGLAARLAKQQWRAERILRLAARRVSLDRGTLVLDVGTAFGVTLQLIRERFGCDVAGVEPSTVAREHAEREFGIRFLGRSMEDLYAPTPVDGQVGLLIFSQVLENIVNPRAALAAARRLLRPGGHLYIDTSNFFYYNAINPYHPYIFSPDTLEDLLAQCGFVVVDREHEPQPGASSAPTDPYLMFLATPGQSGYRRGAVSVTQLIADQRRGLQLLTEAKSKKKAATPASLPGRGR